MKTSTSVYFLVYFSDVWAVIVFVLTEGLDTGWQMCPLWSLCWTATNAPSLWRPCPGRCLGSPPSTLDLVSATRRVNTVAHLMSNRSWETPANWLSFWMIYKKFLMCTAEGLVKLHPFRVTSLYSGGTFDKNYNKRYQPLKFPIPSSTKKVPDDLEINRYSIPSCLRSISSPAWLVSGGAVCCYNGARQRRERLWGVLRHLPPFPDQRCSHQHSHIWLCRYDKLTKIIFFTQIY